MKRDKHELESGPALMPNLMQWRARPDMACDYLSEAWLEFTGRHGPRLSGVRVLVVEEDEEARARTVELLNTAGAQARGVANGTEALDPLEKWRPDVLISDPARDEEGYLFLRSLRRKAAE